MAAPTLATPPDVSPAPRLHAELQQRLDELGWTAARLNREAGLSKDHVRQCLQARGYPHKPALERIIAALAVPDDVAARWRAERAAQRTYSTKALRRCTAPGCSNEFRPKYAGQETCSDVCRGRAHWTPKKGTKSTIDNELKRAFRRKLIDERCTIVRAAAEMGVGRVTLSKWLNRPGHQLRTPQLQKIAAWLGLTFDRARELQGGTGEQRVGDLGRARIATGTLQDFGPAFWQNKERSAPAREALRARLTGREKPEAERAKLSAGLKAYRQRPDAHPLHAHNGTQRQAALAIRGNLRRWHSDWTEEKVTAETVARIQARFRLGSESAALELLKAKSPARKPLPQHMSKKSKARLPIALAELAKTSWQPGDPSYPYGFADDFGRALVKAGLTPERADTLRKWLNTYRLAIEGAARALPWPPRGKS
jgi:transcriptional regulator with XRE-family HTH domain